MKKAELTFSVILLPTDYLMIVLAGLTAYFLRFGKFFTDIRPIIFDLPFKNYLPLVLVIALGWLLIFALAGLYKIRSSKKLFEEIPKIVLACSTGILAIMAYMFFGRELFSSRFILITAWVFSILFVSSGRIIMRLIQQMFLKLGYGVHRVVIIGKDRNTEEIIKEIHANKGLGYKIMDRFPDFNDEVKSKILAIHRVLYLDEIIQADSSISRRESLNIVDFANENHIAFKYAAGPFEARATNIEVTTMAGIPVIEMKKTPLDGWGKVYKRLFDMIASFLLILLTSPIMLLAALAIKLDSQGTVLFKYQRVGQYGQKFTYFKFRSMITGAHQLRYDEEFRKQVVDTRNGTPMVKFQDDPRITRVGKFIRKLSIDELPELFLVLAGKMSLVGPRPHEIEEVEKYEKHHKKVLTIKPGMTGMAQISGRSDLDFEEEVKLDTYYIENWSLKLDLYILSKTPWIVIRGKTAR